MASTREYAKRIEALEAETASHRGRKVIAFQTLYSTGAILRAAVDGEPVERLEGETDKDFRGRIIAKYSGSATLVMSRIHYAEPTVIDIAFVKSIQNVAKLIPSSVH
jgi:hypothetical protein